MEIGERNEKGWKSKNFNNLKNLKIYFENQRILKIGEKSKCKIKESKLPKIVVKLH